MAQATLPARGERTYWLDRPIIPSWQWLAALTVHWEAVAYSVLVSLGLTLRLWDLGSRALHHDESLHAYYAWKLFAGQGYTYDPLMHGPLQFEVTSLFYVLFGDSEFTARLFAALLGTALIALPIFLRHHLGRLGALFAALMLTVSPVFLYFSRFIRDDIYLAFFTLALFICVIRYLETHHARFVYVGAAVLALAVASMEAAYITIFIFVTFLAVEALREYLGERRGPVLSAIRGTSLDTWLTGFFVFVLITVILYSTFFTNPFGIWDTRYSLLSPDRKDILGGLTYWNAQHAVMRGGQPWFYYLLVLPLYEQLAVLFGVAGAIYSVVRRSLVTSFLLWWAVVGLLMYSWAGEKMPWLSMHIALPLVLLAALFLGKAFSTQRRWILLLSGTVFATLLALEVHSTLALSFRDAANPTEMLIYVQTSQDVPVVAQEATALSQRLTGGTSMPIGLDNADVGGWPFIWYFRNFTNITETSNFSGTTCAGQYCPMLIMLEPEFTQYGSTLSKHYVVQKYRWNWWFPEDYKQWFPDHVGSLFLGLSGRGTVASDPLGTGSDWQHLWNWLVYRQPFADRGARWMYVLVRRDLVPGSQLFATTPPAVGSGGPIVTSSSIAALKVPLRLTIGAANGLSAPRGLATDSHGNLYVADPPNHRIIKFSPKGKELVRWGTVGAGPGQFNHLDSPQGIAVGPDGNIYVADTWNQRIQVFSSSGSFLRQWGGGAIGSSPGQFYGPRGLAVGADGRVYVADTGNERIQVFDSQGKYLSSIGVKGTGPGQFTEPSSVALGPAGKMYVADFWNQRIQEFDTNGTFLRSWPVVDWVPQSYDEPYLSVNPFTGVVYATEPQQRRVVAWTSKGKVLGSIGSAQLSLPVGVTVRPDGAIAVSDATGAHVDVFGKGR